MHTVCLTVRMNVKKSTVIDFEISQTFQYVLRHRIFCVLSNKNERVQNLMLCLGLVCGGPWCLTLKTPDIENLETTSDRTLVKGKVGNWGVLEKSSARVSNRGL